MHRSLILMTFTFAITACCKSKCLDNYLEMNYIGFRNTDIDTIIVNAYEKGSNFSTLIATHNEYFQTPPYDALFGYIRDAPASSDYELIFPSIQDTFYLENITTRRRDCNCGSDWNETTSFVLDGARVDSHIVVLRR
jgi:hypothetical protein